MPLLALQRAGTLDLSKHRPKLHRDQALSWQEEPPVEVSSKPSATVNSFELSAAELGQHKLLNSRKSTRRLSSQEDSTCQVVSLAPIVENCRKSTRTNSLGRASSHNDATSRQPLDENSRPDTFGKFLEEQLGDLHEKILVEHQRLKGTCGAESSWRIKVNDANVSSRKSCQIKVPSFEDPPPLLSTSSSTKRISEADCASVVDEPDDQEEPSEPETSPGRVSCIPGQTASRPSCWLSRNSMMPASRVSTYPGSLNADEESFRPARPTFHSSAQSDNGSRFCQFEVHAAWLTGGSSSRFLSRRTSRAVSAADLAVDQMDLLELSASSEFLNNLMVHPSSMKCLVWNILGLVLVFYDCIEVPLEVFDPPATLFATFMEWLTRLFWTFMLVGCFFTGYIRSDGSFEMNPRQASLQYLKTFFPLDLFIVICNWAEVTVIGSRFHWFAVLLRAVRLLRIVRLARLLRTADVSKRIAEFIPFSEQLALVCKIATMMVVFLWGVHLVGCLWYALGNLGNSAFPSNWLDVYNMHQYSFVDRFCMCFHWSMAVFSGDSSGVYQVQNAAERMFATAGLFLGFIVSAACVGSITTSMTQLQLMASEHSSKLSALSRFLLENNISRTLAVRVTKNAQFAMQEEKKQAPEANVDLLKVISLPLLMEVHFEIHSKVLMTHPFFESYSEVNTAGLRKVCHRAISTLSLHSCDILFSSLEVPEVPRMYFVLNGHFQYIQGVNIRTVEQGQWLSEAALWTRWTHCGTAKATKETRILMLSSESFQEIIATHPTQHASLYAMSFVEWLNSLCQDELSDVGLSKEDIEDLVYDAFPNDCSDCSSSESEASEDSTPLPKSVVAVTARLFRANTFSGQVARTSSGSAPDENGSSLPIVDELAELPTTAKKARLSGTRRSKEKGSGRKRPSDRSSKSSMLSSLVDRASKASARFSTMLGTVGETSEHQRSSIRCSVVPSSHAPELEN